MLALSVQCLMVSLMICSSLGAATPAAKPIYELDEAESHFETFVTTFGKQYSSDEEKKLRFEIFKENLRDINERNTDPNQHAVFGITQFSDLTSEEFVQTYTGFIPNPNPVSSYHNLTKTVDAPESYDWRQYGKVTRVGQQGTCGACWTFSATGAIESAFAIKYGQLKEFSEQQILDCDRGGNGCNGGWPQGAINYIVQAGGQDTDQSYPYEYQQGRCRFQPSQVGVKVARMLPYNLNGEQITEQYLLQYGPIAIVLTAVDFQNYHGGVLSCTQTGLDHAVLLVGYGNDGGVPYYIIKNSWGEQWGENGYIRVNRQRNCGLHNNHAAGAMLA